MRGGGPASSAMLEVGWIKIHDSWLFTGIEGCHLNRVLGVVGGGWWNCVLSHVRGGMNQDSWLMIRQRFRTQGVLSLSFQGFWMAGERVTQVILEVGWTRFMTRDSLLDVMTATFKGCRGCLGEFLYRIEVGWFIICDSLPFVATAAYLAGYAATEASPSSGSWSNPKIESPSVGFEDCRPAAHLFNF